MLLNLTGSSLHGKTHLPPVLSHLEAINAILLIPSLQQSRVQLARGCESHHQLRWPCMAHLSTLHCTQGGHSKAWTNCCVRALSHE